MRIIHVVESLDPSQGGPPVVVTRLAMAQASLGHDVKIIAYGSGSQADVLLADQKNTVNNPTIILLPINFIERITSLAARKCFKNMIRAGDIVHLHGLWRPILVAAARVAWHTKTKYVLMPHGMLAPWSMLQKQLKKRFALFVVWRNILDKASMLHVLNDEEANQVRELMLRAPVKIIPNGIFKEEVDDLLAPLSFYRIYPLLKDRSYILFLSRLHYKKGLDYLADTFALVAAQASHVDLVVAGPDGGAQSSFKQQIEKLGIENRVHIVGPLYGSHKYAAMVDALCFCLPSRQEGFSMAILEAMACGLPVVISKQCNFAEVAQADAGEIVELEPRMIADALLRFINNGERRGRMGAKARELVLSRYTWPKIATTTIAVYRRILAEG